MNPQIPIAIVKSRQHEIEYLDDAYYLERALTPVTDGKWALRTKSLALAEVADESLASYAIVFCVNLPAVEPLVAAKLSDYARSGGHVVWICGDNVVPEAYTAMNQAAGNELLPIRLLSVKEPTDDQPDGWHVGWLDPSYPAFMALSNPASLYQSILVSRYVETEPAEEGRATILAKLDNGSPLLVERSIGLGSVLLLGTSTHVDWSNLPLRPIFLPFVAGLAFHLASTEAMQPQLVAGMPIVSPWPVTANREIEILRPTGEAIRLGGSGASEESLRYEDTHEVGIYELRSLDPTFQRRTAFAVNLDSDESIQGVTSGDGLRANFGNRPLVLCEDPTDLASTLNKLREGESLLEMFLVVLLIALIAESYVANRRIEQERPAELRKLEGRRRDILRVFAH